MKVIINILLFFGAATASSHAQNSDIWIRISSSNEVEPYTAGYINSAGEIVIPANKYVYCYTEKFDRIAFVLHKASGDQRNHYYAIDKSENILFRIASWDSAPDDVIDGLFRIIVGDRMGFADMNGNIIIQPVYSWIVGSMGGKWGVLDKYGNIKIPAQYDSVYGGFKNGKTWVEKNGVSMQIDTDANLIPFSAPDLRAGIEAYPGPHDPSYIIQKSSLKFLKVSNIYTKEQVIAQFGTPDRYHEWPCDFIEDVGFECVYGDNLFRFDPETGFDTFVLDSNDFFMNNPKILIGEEYEQFIETGNFRIGSDILSEDGARELKVWPWGFVDVYLSLYFQKIDGKFKLYRIGYSEPV